MKLIHKFALTEGFKSLASKSDSAQVTVQVPKTYVAHEDGKTWSKFLCFFGVWFLLVLLGVYFARRASGVKKQEKP